MINKINNINITSPIYDSLLMISNNLLLITGDNKISIANIDSYNLIKEITLEDSGFIYASCLLNKNMILTSDENKRIIQWKIEDKDLRLISKKENAHDAQIYTLAKMDKDGKSFILSGSYDNLVKIWLIK